MSAKNEEQGSFWVDVAGQSLPDDLVEPLARMAMDTNLMRPFVERLGEHQQDVRKVIVEWLAAEASDDDLIEHVEARIWVDRVMDGVLGSLASDPDLPGGAWTRMRMLIAYIVSSAMGDGACDVHEACAQIDGALRTVAAAFEGVTWALPELHRRGLKRRVGYVALTYAAFAHEGVLDRNPDVAEELLKRLTAAARKRLPDGLRHDLREKKDLWGQAHETIMKRALPTGLDTSSLLKAIIDAYRGRLDIAPRAIADDVRAEAEKGRPSMLHICPNGHEWGGRGKSTCPTCGEKEDEDRAQRLTLQDVARRLYPQTSGEQWPSEGASWKGTADRQSEREPNQ